MPQAVRQAVQALPPTHAPPTHAAALVRPLVTGAPVEHPLVHLAVPPGFAAVGLYVAVALVRRRFIVWRGRAGTLPAGRARIPAPSEAARRGSARQLRRTRQRID